jgi:dTDP-4-dehydrorhamnose reductase
MKILVFGKTGQVASELQRQAGVTALGRDLADLSDPATCAAIIRASDAEVIINAAAYTAVDRAEEEEALATIINGAAPAAMAKAAADKGIPFLHISTDYVFDGSGETAWQPGDATAPQSAYGRSKLAGETGVLAAGGRSVILRTSWVFSPYGGNFVKTMLRLGRERGAVSVVEDQTGGPTAAADIAAALLSIARQMVAGNKTSGIYHFSGAPNVTWADFARRIFAIANIPATVTGVPTSGYPLPAPRPANSRLNNTSLSHDFAIERPDWRHSLKTTLKELGENP